MLRVKPQQTPRQTSWTRGGRIILASLAASAVTLGLVWWYYTRQGEAIEAAVSEQVAAIAEAKAEQIAIWRRERLGDGRVQMASGTIEVARRILSGAAHPTDRSALTRVMRELETEFLYSGAFLVNRDGGVLLQYPAKQPAPSRLADFARAGAAADDVRLEDLYLDSVSRRPLMALTIPARGQGALILEIDPARFLYPFLRSWPLKSATAETSLARIQNGGLLALSEFRYRKGAAFTYWRPLKSLGAPSPAQLESGWQVKGYDYRGQLTLATFRHVPDSSWYVIDHIDAAEVDAPARRLGWEMVFLTALIGIANLAIVGWLWRGRELRIRHEREAWFRAVANDTPANLWMSFGAAENFFINQPFARFLGVDGDHLSSNWTSHLHPDDAESARAHFLACAGASSPCTQEYRMRRSDGEYRWVLSRALPRFSANGRLLGYAGSITDITETREAERQLRMTNAALAAELAERTRHEREIQFLSARLMNAQEDERKRLARELHDDLCQQIAALSIAVGNLKRNIPEQEATLRTQSDRIQQKLVETAETVRQLSHQLHPALLEYSGLVPALQSYCAEFSSLSGIHVTFEADGSFDPVPPFVALNLYRITQEALQNVAKHAQVAEAVVRLRRSQELLSLMIEDRGIGMDPSSSKGLGLVSMKERSRVMGGTIEIVGSPNRGTVVVVKVPVRAADAPPLAAA